jgi:hypothetical protein
MLLLIVKLRSASATRSPAMRRLATEANEQIAVERTGRPLEHVHALAVGELSRRRV